MSPLRAKTENAPGGGQGGTLLVYGPIHPLRPNRGRLTVETVRDRCEPRTDFREQREKVLPTHGQKNMIYFI